MLDANALGEVVDHLHRERGKSCAGERRASVSLSRIWEATAVEEAVGITEMVRS